MTTKKGIDVSEHQGTIDWGKVKPNIDFVIIRAGYGQNNIDKQFKRNANECTRLGIPFGAYWFSYAYTTDMAKKEAEYFCNAIAKYKLTYPACFDFEGESSNYASRNGVTVSKSLLVSMAKVFLSTLEERKYYACIYSNPDYINKGFSELLNTYDLWLAHWGIDKPSRSCGMWQANSNGKVAGINGNVDTDYAYKDYPTIIANLNKSNASEKEKELEKLKEQKWTQYYNLAKEVIAGKWGNGSARKSALMNKGYDYNYVQAIVNLII